MPLSPEDVQNKEFTTVRLREGYDMQEVDEFLDEVEAELTRMHRENDELRDKLAAVTRGGGLVAAAVTPSAPQRDVAASPPAPAPAPATPAPAPAAPAPAPAARASTPAVSGPPVEAAAKVLALAQKTADELVADAKLEADKLLAEARQRADAIDTESSAKVSKIEQDARMRADTLDREAQERHQQVVGRLESEREHLEAQVENLKAFEREYRSRLKAYLESELRKLETSAGTPDGAAVVPIINEAPPADAQRTEAPQAAAGSADASPDEAASDEESQDEAPAEAMATTAAASSTGGSLRSVASLLDDDQR
jgi:DivIVA domain-containing protein